MKLRNTPLSIPAEGAWLEGQLAHAPDVRALAVIARASAGIHPQHGTLEDALASALQQAGYATLLVDLLTHHEMVRDPDARFNVPQLANRMLGVADWITHQPALATLAIGLIGAETTSAAVVRAAWKAPERFAAIVCRAGRPDLAGATPLKALSTPIRIVIGSEDPESRIVAQAFALIGAERDWQVVGGVGGQFTEPGALDALARLSGEWLALKLPPSRADTPTAADLPSAPAAP